MRGIGFNKALPHYLAKNPTEMLRILTPKHQVFNSSSNYLR